MSLRILSGKYKGRVLYPPKTKELRPTQTSMREAFFNKIQWEIQGANFLDVFAGSGIMGLEALSRGAKSVTFIEKDKINMKAIKNLFEKFQIKEEAFFYTLPADKGLSLLTKQKKTFSLIFLDPPYSWKKEEKEKVLLQLYTGNLLTLEGQIFLEERSKEKPDYALGGRFIQQVRIYGGSTLVQLHM